MTKQLRRTAGFLIRTENTLIHVDPGPGAVVYLNKLGIDMRNLTAVIVSHNHLDHANDAAVLVEGMTNGGRRKRGAFLGSAYAIEGGDDFVPALSPYHRNMLQVCKAVKPGEETEIGNLHVRFTPTWHDEPTGVGVFFSDGRVRVAYLSDTGYLEELAQELEHFKPHAIIFNLIFDSEEIVPHTTTGSVVKFLEAYRPSLVFLQHFGAKILLKHMEKKIAKDLSTRFGVDVRALSDGDVIDLPLKTQTTLASFMEGEK